MPARTWPAGSLMRIFMRSEEHTSELQSQSNLVCRLLLEKKKNMSHCIAFSCPEVSLPRSRLLYCIPRDSQFSQWDGDHLRRPLSDNAQVWRVCSYPISS